MSLLRWNRLDIEAFVLTIELLTLENAVLNEELSVASEDSVLETLNNDVLMIAIELKKDASFEIKSTAEVRHIHTTSIRIITLCCSRI